MQEQSEDIFVLKIGGSFLIDKTGQPNVSYLQHLISIIKNAINDNVKKLRLIIVVGGGIIARNYITAAQVVGGNLGIQDHLGILVSRLNAQIVIECLIKSIGTDLVWPQPLESLSDVRNYLTLKRVVVLGGLQPGQSTTAVAALCAEYCQASKVIYSTNVDGVYTQDPVKYPSARKLNQVSYTDLRKLFCQSDNTLPGQYRIMDNMAITILERSHIQAIVLSEQVFDIFYALIGIPTSKVSGGPYGTIISDTTIESSVNKSEEVDT